MNLRINIVVGRKDSLTFYLQVYLKRGENMLTYSSIKKKQKSFNWHLVLLMLIYVSSFKMFNSEATAQKHTYQKKTQEVAIETPAEEIDYSEMIFEEYWEDLAYFQEAKDKDPFAPYNKFMAALTFVLDIAFCRGLAELYIKIFPKILRASVCNLIQNTCELRSTVNDILQKKPKQGVKSITRFLINTIFGCCGLFDVVKKAKIKFHSNDFGMTLGSYGIGCGPFIMQLTGPSTFRDFLANFIDCFIDPFHITYLCRLLRSSWPLYYLLKIAHKRSETLKYSTQAKNAKNPYELMKIAHLQTREYKVAKKRFAVLQKKSETRKLKK